MKKNKELHYNHDGNRRLNGNRKIEKHQVQGFRYETWNAKRLCEINKGKTKKLYNFDFLPLKWDGEIFRKKWEF